MSLPITRRTALSGVLLLVLCSLASAFVSPHATPPVFGSRHVLDANHATSLRATGHSTDEHDPITSFSTAMWEHNKAVRSVVAGIVFSFALVVGSPISSTTGPDWFVAHAEDQQSLLTSPTNQEKKDLSLVEEVWTLIDKFYIDRSFNGQVRALTS
jgi:hypothetical protein